MRRIVTLGLLVAAASACATAEDLAGASADANVVAESGSLEDGSRAEDSTAADTRADGTLADTSTSDGSMNDSAADSKGNDARADGSASDTSVTDAATDGSAADTNVADTRVADAAVADALVVDTATDAGACAIRGCANGSESRSGCANARVIGRTTAGSSGGATIDATTCNAVNNLGGGGASCADVGWDHAYRLFMRAGESITVSVVTGEDCDQTVAQWNATLKIYENGGCAETSCTTRTVCESSLPSISKQFSAPRDGWYIIVVDGMNGYHEGPYTLTVKLTCTVTGCECS